ncbi:SDR family oxidoreductase [Halomonas sp. SCS19]|uniref:SDR family oxidoreductase n=1 Tax=Halomonas sp. SCS19 TaxID=2950870 RepID=UPI0032DFF2AC
MKTILITGAGSGLGEGTALALARAGHKVIATTEIWPQVTSLKEKARQQELTLTVEKLDITDKRDRDAVFSSYGHQVDIVVANAAIGETGPLAEIPVDRVRRVFETNVFSTLEFVQPYAREFVERGKGKIVLTSSIAGFTTFPYLGPYVASKHALEGMAQLLYEELAPLGVKVATLNPGPFRTGFNDRMYNTLDQWYDPDACFTPEKPIRSVQQQFAGDDLQQDPAAMIDEMARLIPLDEHRFRNVYPDSFEASAREYQDGLWDRLI